MKHARHSIFAALLALFILGNHRGYLALWKDGSPEPEKIYPYRVQMLPPEVREKLDAGIAIRSMEDLCELLEDFTS